MTITKIRQLYRMYKTPLHVQAHMKQVANVAVYIAKKIKKNGHKVDINFVRHLALVHDLMKVISFRRFDETSFTEKPTKTEMTYYKKLQKKYPDVHDVIITSQILKKYNEKRLAAAVLSQQFDAIISKSHPLRSLEEKIVYYADKRVAHTNIVSLKYRFKEGSMRYGKHNRNIEKKICILEKDLSMVAEENISNIKESDIV